MIYVVNGGTKIINEAGESNLFCLEDQREAEERTWKYTMQQFFWQ